MNTNGVKYVYIGHNKSLMEMSCVEVIEERKKKVGFFQLWITAPYISKEQFLTDCV